MDLNLKTLLISLGIVAVVLGIITFYVVFFAGGGTYLVSSPTGPNATIFATGTAPLATTSSTASSSLALASSTNSESSSTASSTVTGGSQNIVWMQGNETMTITGAALSGTQLTLDVQVQMGAVAECVPLTLRMIADEQGDLAPPITQQFAFPDSGNCNGTPGETYSAQQVVFDISSDPTAFPFIFTTGGAANTLFEVVQNAGGGFDVELPPNAG